MMSSIKRVIGSDGNLAPYDIYANVITLHGNLNVVGNTSVINTANLAISDNIIVLNSNETGSGVTNVTSGITIDRGLLPNVSVLWNESSGYWTLTNDGSTYSEIVTVGMGGGAGGSTTQVQYNSGGTLTGSSNFTFTNGNLNVYRTVIGNGNVTTNTSGVDLTLSAAGTGYVFVNDVLKMGYQATAPSNLASTTMLFANTVGSGNTGLYVVNSATGDELISKNRMIALSILLS